MCNVHGAVSGTEEWNKLALDLKKSPLLIFLLYLLHKDFRSYFFCIYVQTVS